MGYASSSVDNNNNNTFYSNKPIEFGVPHGSVLGPTFISLFINDIYRLDISGKICLFADVTSFTWRNPDITAFGRTVSNDFITIVPF